MKTYYYVFVFIVSIILTIGYKLEDSKWGNNKGDKMTFSDSFPQSYALSISSPKEKVKQAIEYGSQKWSKAGSKFSYKKPVVADGVTSVPFEGNESRTSGLYAKVVPPGPGGSFEVALTITKSDDKGKIKNSSISFNNMLLFTMDSGNRNRFDLPTVALHELGHRLGLDHPERYAKKCRDKSAAMDPSTDPKTVQRELKCDDKEGVKEMYGAKGCGKPSPLDPPLAGIEKSNRRDVIAILNGGAPNGKAPSVLRGTLDRNPDVARRLNGVLLSHQSTLASTSATVTPDLRADLAPVLRTLETTLRMEATGERSRHRNPARVADRLRSVRHRLDEVEGMTLSEAREHLLGEAPSSFTLTGNVPNPASGLTAIRYELPEAATVRIEVYDLTGRRVRTLVAGQRQQKGRHREELNTTGLSSGTYLYRVTAGDKSKSGRLTVVQ